MGQRAETHKTIQAGPKRRFPLWYWLLPVFFLLIGGIVAAYLVHRKYHASWWDLPVLGLLITILVYILIGMILTSTMP